MPARPARHLAPLALATVLLAAVPACSSDGSDAAPDGAAATSTTATTAGGDAAEGETTTTSRPEAEAEAEELSATDDLYAVPDPIPDVAHGTLLRYQEVAPSLVDGATTYRILYSSTSLEGDPIVVSGTALVPDAPAPAEGRRLLTLAHGTTGIADECAPSKDPGGELSLTGPQVAKGWLVAATDYEGLGTPGRHPYLVGESEGRGTIDAILAAGQLPEADPGDQLAIAGYSQGGHGALWAGQVAAEWAPDLDVVGTFAGAPATEMRLILGAAPSGFSIMMVAGYDAAYPEAPADTFLTPAGMAKLPAVDDGCTGDIFEAVSDTPKAELVQAGAAARAPWKELADANDPGRVAVDAPILVIHSKADTTVPALLTAAMVTRMCGIGQAVERRVRDEGESHVRAAPPAYRDGFDWLEDRFDGEPLPADSCPG